MRLRDQKNLNARTHAERKSASYRWNARNGSHLVRDRDHSSRDVGSSLGSAVLNFAVNARHAQIKIPRG
jgi:hypothetical protein